jgi:uncharacterized membrane protein YfcA
MQIALLVIGYLLAAFAGLSLGLVGSGGSILTIPILHYFLGLSSNAATTHSLFIVGICALFSLLISKKKPPLKSMLLSAVLPSVTGVLLARRLVFPAIPSQINFGFFSLTKDECFMIMFAGLMLLASLKMIRHQAPPGRMTESQTSRYAFALTMLGTGFLTGMLGAGGGFLIIPALVLLLKQEMEEAVLTSLAIISLNTLLGFSSDMLSGITVNWSLLLVFTSLSITGATIGIKLRKSTKPEKLKTGFGWFILLTGISIILKEVL